LDVTFLSALLSSAPEKRPRNRIKYGGNGESRGEKDPAARKGKKKRKFGETNGAAEEGEVARWAWEGEPGRVYLTSAVGSDL